MTKEPNEGGGDHSDGIRDDQPSDNKSTSDPGSTHKTENMVSLDSDELDEVEE